MRICEPRYATRRRPERDELIREFLGDPKAEGNFGPRLIRMSELLGTPFMEWQRLVAMVGGELIVVDGKIVPAYREVVATIPRQNGKTTLVLSWECDRALTWGRRQRIAYTAQTGLDARKKLLEDQLPMIEGSPLKVTIKNVRRAQGSEGIDFHGGSQLDVLASTESAGHGRTLHLGVIDEAFKDEDDRREGSMLPAMTTVDDAQLLIVSTQGTDKSTYLNRKVDTGRDMILGDRDDAEIAYFEWSADNDADIDSVETYKSCMPAYGVTISERAIRHARATMTEGEFRRAYLNQRTNADERVIPLDVWTQVIGDAKPGDGLVIAIDCNPERTHSSIAVADKHGLAELLLHEEGTAWLLPQAVRIAKLHGASLAYDPAGPAGVFGDMIQKEGIRTREVSGRDLAHACAFLFDAVIDRKISIRPHDALDAAVAAAKKRVSGDSWVWARRTKTDISPIVALSLAAWVAQAEIDPVANVH